MDRMSPIVAAIASLVIPGLGQALSGEVLRGAAIFIGLLVIVGILFVTVVGAVFLLVVEPIIHILASYDAYKIAQPE